MGICATKLNKMKEYFKKVLIRFQKYWKKINKDYVIVVKSINLVSPYVLLIDFTADNVSFYITIHGNYKEIRSKHLKQNQKEPISFENYMEEINLLIPTEDIIKDNYKQWIIKQ